MLTRLMHAHEHMLRITPRNVNSTNYQHTTVLGSLTPPPARYRDCTKGKKPTTSAGRDTSQLCARPDMRQVQAQAQLINATLRTVGTTKSPPGWQQEAKRGPQLHVLQARPCMATTHINTPSAPPLTPSTLIANCMQGASKLHQDPSCAHVQTMNHHWTAMTRLIRRCHDTPVLARRTQIISTLQPDLPNLPTTANT